MIRPNSRNQFTAVDFEFISSTVSGNNHSSIDHLAKLLIDPESLDIILDDERLFRRILAPSGCLKISPHLFFYLLVRRSLLYIRIDDRVLTDYLASMLTEYARAERIRRPVETNGQAIEYLTDAVAAMDQADDKMRFFIQVFIANYSLFLSGVFPKFLQHRKQYKASPDIGYYEKLGSTHYRVASHHQLARKYELSTILHKLSDCFSEIRLALNSMAVGLT